MLNLVIVNSLKDWNFNISGVKVIPAKAYVTDSQYAEIRNVRIYNLSRSYKYQSIGYYVSLLAEARGHKIFPSVSTIQDLKSQTIIRITSDDIDQLIQKSLAKIRSNSFSLHIYFGKSIAKQYENLSKQLYNLFPLPLLQAHFVFNKKWILQNVNHLALNDFPENDKIFAIRFAEEYFAKKQFRKFKKNNSIYDLAILINSANKFPPSDEKAIKKFISAAEDIGFSTEIITKDDFSKIPEFDALFIRDTTAVNHYTYRFAQRAEAEGLVVIDDPASIVKCTNKVYLEELLTKAKIPRPKTLIVHKDNLNFVADFLGFPCVLKQPDSAFSQGVIKVNNHEELLLKLEEYLDDSDLVIAQEFMPTDFDWRIGILDKKPIYACKYFMAKNHWQILNWQKRKRNSDQIDDGDSENLPLDKVPEKVLKIALRAANLVGDGFYGVDLKEKDGKVFVVEINDNPSIENGVEDTILKDKLYTTIMLSILNRIKIMKGKIA